MRTHILILFAITMAASCSLTAQVSINTDGSPPNSSAMLDVNSDTAGILIPRMTQAQCNLISNPVTGLMIYQTDVIAGFYYYNGSVWEGIANKTNMLSIMESLQNGVRDIDGNHYETVLIGYQIWMAENLATTKYDDGTDIPLVTDNSAWAALTTPGYCWYDNDQATYGSTYGALYNWYTVNTGNLCPTGWHVPTDGEWTTLTTYLGGESVAGGKLKEAGLAHWNSPNTGATNETGFTALPGGVRDDGGTFMAINGYGGWWSATEVDAGVAWGRGMFYYSSGVYRDYGYNKKNGFSVRCLRD